MAKAHGVPGNSPLYGVNFTGEYLTKLTGPAGLEVMDEMRRSDPQCKAVLKAITLPVVRANYYVEAATDSAADKEIAELIQANLLEDMSMTWRDTLRHICLHLPLGFMPMEKIYEYSKEDNRIKLRKLDPRLPRSIEKFNFNREKRRLESLSQRDTDGKEYKIPIEKLIVFSNEKEGDNWEGIPLLRPAYGSWWVKNTLIKIDAMKHDRHGVGIPKGTVRAGVGPKDPEWKDMETVLEAVQAQEKSYVIAPDGSEIEILGSGSKGGTDVLPSIRYHNEQIAVSVLAQFLSLGTTETGSRALGNSFIDFFLLSLQEVSEYIVETLNRFLIRELVSYNWNVKDYPVLKVQRIKELDMATISALKTAGLLTPDAELENTIRKQLGLPEIDEKEYEIRHQAPLVTDPNKPDDVGDEDEDSEVPDENELHDHHKTINLSEQSLSEEEQIVNFAEIEARLNYEEQNLLDQIIDIKNTQQKSIVMQIVGGKRVQNITVPAKKDMFEILLKAYKDNLKAGKAEILDEIQRQNPTLTLADRIPDNQFDDLMEEEISLKIEGASDKLKAMIMDAALDLKKQGYSGDEFRQKLEEKVDEISQATWKTMAATVVSQGWGQGRQRGGDQFSDQIDYTYRSALLDGNACIVCRQKDGTRHAWGDPEYMAPDPECHGTKAKCRCVNIAVMKAESEGVE